MHFLAKMTCHFCRVKLIIVAIIMISGLIASYLIIYSILLVNVPPGSIHYVRTQRHLQEVHLSSNIVTIIGSQIESHFETLKIHNCSFNQSRKKYINWNNKYWQQVDSKQVYLYSAYYDTRYIHLDTVYHYVRIIGMAYDNMADYRVYCYLTYIHLEQPIVVEGEGRKIWLDHWDKHARNNTYHSFLYTCPIPLSFTYNKQYPTKVSISWILCGSLTNELHINKNGVSNHVSQRKNYAICVKGLNLQEDKSKKIIEWIELNLLLGANKIYFYVFNVHDNITSVLNHYLSLNKIDVTYISLPGDQPNDIQLRTQYLKRSVWQKRRNELIPYNDCLYKNIYKYHFIIPLDIDEVIIPLKSYSWSQMLDKYFAKYPGYIKKYASFSAQNIYFFDNYSNKSQIVSTSSSPMKILKLNSDKLKVTNSTKDEDLHHILHHRMRSLNASIAGHSVKSFISTQNTKTIFNHYPLKTLYFKLKPSKLLPTSIVQMNHYKDKCPRDIYSQCKSKFLKYVKIDNSVEKYGQQLYPNVEEVARSLNLI